MADIITPKEEIKVWFQTGKKPTQAQFAAWMDSYWHKSEGMSIANVDSLQAVLNSKANLVQVTADLASKVDKVDGKGLSTNDFTDEEKAALAASSIEFVNYNKGGNGGDEFLRNGDSVFIDLKANADTGFDPTSKKGLICFSLEAVEDEDDSSATVDFGLEYVKLRWTDANSEIQTRYLYSNTGGTNTPGVKVRLKDIWGNVCLAYFTPNWDGVCILISATISSAISNASGTVDTITLNASKTTYTVSADSASTIKLIAETTGCSVTLPTDLTADKAVTFLIPDSSKAITVDGTIYQPGDTVFCVFDYDDVALTGSWTVNNTIAPTVTDYKNVTVKYALTTTSDKVYPTATSRGYKVAKTDSNVAKQDLVAVLSHVYPYDNTTAHDALYGLEQGLYYVSEIENNASGTENLVHMWIKQIAKGTALQIVNATAYNAGVWDKTYPGATNSLVTFERLADKANSATVAETITNIAALQAEKTIDLGTSITRTEGKCYFDISSSDYDKAMTAGRVVALMRDDFEIVNSGTQDTSIQNGYEPVYIRVKRYVNGVLNQATTITVALSLTTTTKAQLKDIYGKTFYVVGSLKDSAYLFALGVQQEEDVPDTIIPANADVVESLTGDYAATQDTAANVSIQSAASGATFTLPTSSAMTEDKNIKLYLSKSSSYSVTIVNGSTTSELEPGGYAELFYSATSLAWTITVTNPDTAAPTKVIGGAYEAIQLISSFYQNEGSASTYHWVKVCTLKDTHTYSGYTKHVLVFDIFSEGVTHGMGYGSFFYNINDDSSYSKFVNMGLDFVTQTGYRLTSGDFCVRWNGSHEGTSQESELWVRLPDNGVALYFAIRAHGGTGQPKTLTMSSSTWATKVASEYSVDKPSEDVTKITSDAVVNVFSCEDSKMLLDLSDKVTKSGDVAETITGVKTFTSTISAANLSGTNTGDETASSILTKIGDGTQIAAQYLPSYVDDVVEGLYVDATTFTVSGTAITLETGKIYVSTDTNYQYRWTGTALIHINTTDLSGYVDLTTAQTISGTKTFSSTTSAIVASTTDGFGVTIYATANKVAISATSAGTIGIKSTCSGTKGSGIMTSSTGSSGIGLYAIANGGTCIKLDGVGVSKFISFFNGMTDLGYGVDKDVNASFHTLMLDSTATCAGITNTTLTTAGIVTNTAAGVLGTTSVIPIENGGTGSTSKNFVDLTTDQTKTGTLTATKFITTGGTATQFVKGDGSLDSSTYQQTTLSQNKIWMGNASNVATETNTYLEWATGITSPGQKEVKGLVTEMIVADGSTIAIPVVFHKTITLTTATAIQLLADTYAGRYYIIDSISIIARQPSLSQYPIISIGNNSSSYNNIVAATTLSSLAAGRNGLTLTTAAQSATVEAASSLYLNITQAAIGTGTFEVIIRGFLTNL